jgi:hypothetical protein
VKAALIALVLAVLAPVHITAVLAGASVSFPAGWLILGAEVLASAGLAWLAIRVLRRFRSAPWPRSAGPAGAMP